MTRLSQEGNKNIKETKESSGSEYKVISGNPEQAEDDLTNLTSSLEFLYFLV